MKVQRRYPLHSVFFAYTLVTLLLAVGAFNANNNLLFWLFGLSLGLLMTSGIVSGTMMMALRVERLGIEAEPAGGAVRVRYRVSNTGRWLPIFAVTVHERLEAEPTAVGGDNARAGEAGAGDSRLALVRWAGVDFEPRAYVSHVPARTSVIVEGLALSTGRGRLVSTGWEAVTTFPFGFIKKSLWHAAAASVVVPPRREEVDAGLVEQGGGRSSGGVSDRTMDRDGYELVGVRPYGPGDPPRLVAWRASARLGPGELVVKQTATGSPRRLRVVLTLRRAAREEASELAIARAAALLRLAHERRMVTGLSVWTDFGYGLDVAPGAAAGGAWALINELALLKLPAGSVGGADAGTGGAGASSEGASSEGASGEGASGVRFFGAGHRGSAGDVVLRVEADGAVGASDRGADRAAGRAEGRGAGRRAAP